MLELRIKIFSALVFLAVLSNCKKEESPTLRKLLLKSIEAPSWKFQSIDHEWSWHQKYNDKGFQALSLFVKKFEKSYKSAKHELIWMFGRESLIESRLKPLERISDQLDENGNLTVKDIYDVITWRVTFPTVHQLVEAKSRFIKSSRFGVAIVKCFGVCPRAGRFSASGYRGITLIAEIDGKPLEIQLMTPYMVMWADWAYSVLLDETLGLKKDVAEYGRNLSEYYYNLDSIRDKRPACPRTLAQTNMKTLTTKLVKSSKIFDALGDPPSACQFWNDLAVNKNHNPGVRREVLSAVVKQKASGHGNKPSVIDIDNILKPGNLKESKKNSKDKKGTKRTLEWPVYYYY
ncbi:uncharacterized protein LOC114539490 [Dendronephthya gigantea]|uniref:uncharacterized protein LOC114539490 n=1 Tax=Dendronephthya gigantea TaxID=151771 RepID=UPI00106DAB06|nr:uncharacterized protein LOC114539490 [Dendronephthya gigantea]